MNVGKNEIITSKNVIRDKKQKKIIVLRNTVSVQRKKKEVVNTELCDRFYLIYLQSGMKTMEFSSSIGVASFSYVTEIKNYVLEPSKNMIMTVCKTFGISADWLLFGYGKQFRVSNEILDEKAIMITGLKSVIGYLERNSIVKKP